MATKKVHILTFHLVHCGGLSSVKAYNTEEETARVVIYEGPKRFRPPNCI